MKLIYKGQIQAKDFGENCDAIFLGDDEEPLAMLLKDNISQRVVSVKYFISEVEKSEQALRENHLLTLHGSLEADYQDTYSECTGYLWTNENIQVGGHDLLNEISSNDGKYLYLEIVLHSAETL